MTGGTPLSDPAGPASAEPLIQMMLGLHMTGIVQAGVELGVFDQIAGANRQTETIASALNTDPRGTRILLDALAALGLLERHEGYHLTQLAGEFLVTGRPGYLGDMFDVLAGPWAWAGYPRLAETVRRGGTVAEQPWETPGHEFWRTFSPSSVGAVSRPGAQALAELIEPWAGTRDSLEILDVACGSGLFSLVPAAQHPNAHATLLDSVDVLDLTKDVIEQLGLAGRTSFIAGDAFEVPLGGPYDLIIVSHLLHHFSEERCRTLLSKLAPALEPDGRLVIHEFISGAAPPVAPFPYLFSVIMLTSTREGEAHSLSTYERLLREAGFAPPVVHVGQGLPSHFLVTQRAR
jgi:C-methyltransferase